MSYAIQNFKIPCESSHYPAMSKYAINAINSIINDRITTGNNKIIINTNLMYGLPMENINKIAGPIIEAWAYEVFLNTMNDSNNQWNLINVEAQSRLSRADILLQFKYNQSIDPVITSEVDVKATSEDLESSGRSPNITSFARIRTAYIEDPNYLFIILSLNHKVYSKINTQTGLVDGIMEVVDHHAYDIKYISESDINYNPALGTGQIQIKDINYITTVMRNSWEFCQLLDNKYLSSSKRTFTDWHELAIKHSWVK